MNSITRKHSLLRSGQWNSREILGDLLNKYKDRMYDGAAELDIAAYRNKLKIALTTE